VLQDDLWNAISFLSSKTQEQGKDRVGILTPPPNLTLTRQQSCTLLLSCKGKMRTEALQKLWLLFNGNHCFSRRPIHCATMPWDIVDPRIQRAVPNKISPSRSSWPLLISTGKPTVSFNDPGLGHLRILSAQIIRNIVFGLKKHLCIWLGWNCVCRSRHDRLPGGEPAELTEEIVLDPKPDSDAVSVEVKSKGR